MTTKIRTVLSGFEIVVILQACCEATGATTQVAYTVKHTECLPFAWLNAEGGYRADWCCGPMVSTKNPGHSLARLCQKCRHPSHYRPATTFIHHIKARRFTFFGHLARMDENTDASQATFEPPPEIWRLPPGRPRTTWMKNIDNDLSSLDLWIYVYKARVLVQNRLSGDRCLAQHCALVAMQSTTWLD